MFCWQANFRFLLKLSTSCKRLYYCHHNFKLSTARTHSPTHIKHVVTTKSLLVVNIVHTHFIRDGGNRKRLSENQNWPTDFLPCGPDIAILRFFSRWYFPPTAIGINVFVFSSRSLSRIRLISWPVRCIADGNNQHNSTQNTYKYLLDSMHKYLLSSRKI